MELSTASALDDDDDDDDAGDSARCVGSRVSSAVVRRRPPPRGVMAGFVAEAAAVDWRTGVPGACCVSSSRASSCVGACVKEVCIFLFFCAARVSFSLHGHTVNARVRGPVQTGTR